MASLILTWSVAAASQPAATRPASAEEVARVAARLTDPDAAVRLAAVEALGRFDVPEARQALMQARRDANPRVKLAALRALVMLRAPEFQPVSIEALYDGDEALRLLAIPWVAESKPRGATPPLVGLLVADETSTAIRLAAAKGLGVLREDTGIPALAVALNVTDVPETVTDEVRIEAAKSLGLLGGPFAIEELLKATEHPSVRVRPVAVVALAPHAGSTKWSGRILAAAGKADTQTRYRFLVAARESVKATAAVFKAFVKDEDWSVRMEAGAGLSSLKDTEGVALLIEALASGDGTAGEQAHAYLRRFTGQSFPPEVAAWRAWWASAQSTFTWMSAATGPAGAARP